MQDDPAGAPPEEVVVFETVGSVDNFVTAVRNTPGMNWLADWSEDEIVPDEDFYLGDREASEQNLTGRLYLVMSNQVAIDQLISLFARYKRNPNLPFVRGLNAWKKLFVQLHDVRRWGVQDRLEETGILKVWEEEIGQGQDPLRFEAELWCRETQADQEASFARFQRIVESEQGRCITQSVLPQIAYHGVLVEAPASAVRSVLEETDTTLVRANDVMFFRPLGQSAFPIPEEVQVTSHGGSPLDLEGPSGDPIVALLDGLPLENHDFLNGRLTVDDPDGWAAETPAADRHHGTNMASLITRGNLDDGEIPLNSPLYVRPVMKPDPRDWRQPRVECIPADNLPVDLLYRAIRRIVEGEGETPAAAPSVRIINLSLGDPSQPFNRYLSPWARLLDWLAYKYNLLFVVSAGNCWEDIQLGVNADMFSTLTPNEIQTEIIKGIQLIERRRSLLSPAESMNSLTVGSIHDDSSTPAALVGPFDPYVDRFLPSPYSRIGPGFRRSIKPEILVPGGRLLYRQRLLNEDLVTVQRVLSSRAPGLRVAGPSQGVGRTGDSYYSRGTSDSAALVSRAGASAYEALLRLTSEPGGEVLSEEYFSVLVKALLVHGCSWGQARDLFQAALGDTYQGDYFARYLGYGIPDFGRAISCTDQRATILGVGSLTDGRADVFRVPLPPSLATQTIWRRLTVTLAWNSPINPRSRKYRNAHLWFSPTGDKLRVKRKDAGWQSVRRGTLQHEVLEGESAPVFADGDTIAVHVNCRADAGKLTRRVKYALAVTLEVNEGINVPIYEEIRTRLRTAVSITPGSTG